MAAQKPYLDRYAAARARVEQDVSAVQGTCPEPAGSTSPSEKMFQESHR